MRFADTVFSFPPHTLDRSRGEAVSNGKSTAGIELASPNAAALAQNFIDERVVIGSEAWKLWNEDMSADFMDASLAGAYSRDEARRCLPVGLLCVQESPDLRPTMSSVVLMLISDQTTRKPAPAQPPLFASWLGKKASVSDFSLAVKTETTTGTQSVNQVSISMMEPR